MNIKKPLATTRSVKKGSQKRSRCVLQGGGETLTADCLNASGDRCLGREGDGLRANDVMTDKNASNLPALIPNDTGQLRRQLRLGHRGGQRGDSGITMRMPAKIRIGGMANGEGSAKCRQRPRRPEHLILVTGFVGTSLAFACFSGAAIVSKRREFLYLGGLLSAGFSILFWMRFASFIFGSSASMFNIELYLGLLIFLGYIVFDTQEIIEKAHHGDLDYVKHALTLFTDFIAVLVRILVIMLKNSAEKKREENKRKKRS
ncbi:Bax inhibitor 1 [Dendrobium catenatum]|uniref:Bax inhibitor 1 n=1 Tax=Dendrobium catenatum TaxID=906689 RepID=A0A2I0VMN3_9ASPA|nr:Bax inhibitor 1 [Dendrobium catenatum]